MLAALWFGDKKPNMNMFLEPFVKGCVHLQQADFKWSVGHIKYTTKVFPSVLVSDCTVRPLLLNLKQFNGEVGFSFCVQRGVMVGKGQGQTRVYPLETKCDLRSPTQTIKFAECALERSTPVMGVKGPSILSLLPGFNIILGVARACANLWYYSENSGLPWYIGRSVSEVDGF